ncbi:unnamed protein product [Closterium sp. NIES-65]|nr:unnamed protein product [Closterium sp. NIES-65]
MVSGECFEAPQCPSYCCYSPSSRQDFVRSLSARRRYWARSFIGWRRFSAARPGTAHRALARLHARGRLEGGIITQNVDRRGGGVIGEVTEGIGAQGTGTAAREGETGGWHYHAERWQVVCMECGDISCRRIFQERIKGANPECAVALEHLAEGRLAGSDDSDGGSQMGDIEISWAAAVEHLEEGKPAGSDESFGMRRRQQRIVESGSADSGMSERELMGMRRRPDGDIEISEEEWERHGEFVVPSCGACGGVLKPNVVLFGDNLPPARNQEAARMMSSAESLLVVGSSLMVLSAFRIASQCMHEGTSLAPLAVGPSRADKIPCCPCHYPFRHPLHSPTLLSPSSQCVHEGKPLALLAVGPNRADGIAQIKIEARCGEVRCGEVRCGEV